MKTIIHPGNGLNFPTKGEYVKASLIIYDLNKKIIFDKSFLDIRYGCNECNVIKLLEDLLGEMSLFEKCSLEIEANSIKNSSYYTEEFMEEINKYKKLIFEIEIIDISSFPHK
jgi:hypothetical protein